MATTLLVKAIDITKGTPLSGNIDVNKYLTVIKEVQVFVIENILGTKLYKKLLIDYAADTVTGDYLILLENYIQPIIIHSTAAEYIIQGSYNVANGGIYKHLPENAETVSKEEVSFLAQHHRNKADSYVSRLQVFLCDTNLPEYKNSQDEQYDIDPNSTSSFTGGWDLGDAGRDSISDKNIYGY
tara:strand:+ start:3503 stop:4054 length:552 start_codon:yes stop_codon:yes gene_type:complete